MTDDPYALVKWDGCTLDRITAEALHAAEKILGYPLSVVQGSYNAGKVSASAGTHDGGGAVDLKTWDADNKVHALRTVGFAAWHRLPSQGPWGEHVHAILIGNTKLSASAARQVDDYRAGLNGLAGHAPDPTWRPNPIPVFRWPPLLTRGPGIDALIKSTRERLKLAKPDGLRARLLRASLEQLLKIRERPKT
jgi:hypothetical protein